MAIVPNLCSTGRSRSMERACGLVRPWQAYGAAATELSFNTTVAGHDGSFLSLEKIDHLLNDGQPPRLVVYVPWSELKPTVP